MTIAKTSSLATVLAMIFSCPAFAQAQSVTPPNDGAQQQATGLEDIIVTAERRTENLQKTAVAVDVLGGEEILNRGVKGPDDLGALAPALTVAPSGGGRLNFFLRGVGNFTVNPNFDSAVAFNYNNVYIGKPGSTNGFFYDLERIEVLKGPQGTLYGRNATGGAINVLPMRPRLGEMSSYVSASYGNYDAVTAEGAINVPFGDSSAFRISGNLSSHDGYLSDGSTDDDSKSVRVQWLTEFTPNLSVRLAADYTAVRGTGLGSSYFSTFNFVPGSGYVAGPGLAPSIGLFDPRAQAFRRGLFLVPPATFAVPIDLPGFVDNDYRGVSAEVTWKTDLGDLTFIPAYRSDDQSNNAPTIGSAGLSDASNEQKSVELRFVGNRIGMFDYQVGAYYFSESTKTHFSINQQALADYQDTSQDTTSYAGFGRITANLTDRLRLVGGIRYTDETRDFSATQNSFVVVCTTFPMSPCIGAPLFPTVNTFSELPAPFILPPSTGGATPLTNGAILLRTPSVSRDQSFSSAKTTYRGAIEYDLGERSLLYASVETGFRSGGAQTAAGFEIYRPEEITAYTIGSKNRLLDNNLQINLEGFYWEYRDQQLASVTVDTAGNQNNFVKNVGSSTIYGADVEATYLLTPNTLLNAQIQYLKAEYDDFGYDVPAVPLSYTTCGISPVGGNAALSHVDCLGKPSLNSPEWTLNFGAEQTFDLSNFKIVLSADTQYRTSRWIGAEFALGQLQDATWISNLQANLSPHEGDWSVTAFIKNIEDDRYKVNSFLYTFGGAVIVQTAPPRTYGVRVSKRF